LGWQEAGEVTSGSAGEPGPLCSDVIDGVRLRELRHANRLGFQVQPRSTSAVGERAQLITDYAEVRVRYHIGDTLLDNASPSVPRSCASP
jgi:hypothetical protein